jgi:flagellar biosynthetic protein FlhB
MAGEQQETSQKTEEPTQKRLDEALERGQIAHSKEITNFVMLLLMTVLVIFMLPEMMKAATLHLRSYVTEVHNFHCDYDADDLFRLFLKILGEIALLVMVPFLIAMSAGIVGNVIQHGLIYAPEAMAPKISKISPFAGVKRMFSMRTVLELVKGLVRMTVIGATIWMVVRQDIAAILALHDVELASAMLHLLKIISRMLIAICFMQGIIALIDYLYERHAYLQNLRMTKQEVKDELKQSEGDPLIKSKIRGLRLERAKRRIVVIVPEATVIITNPTHLSIALQYHDDMPAPKVIAKGQDQLALQIREVAKQHSIPLIENKILARTLYDSVDWDQYIKPEHFKAVAQIMTKLRNIRNK